MVQPDVALAAAHVLNQSNCDPALNVQGNSLATCRFVPQSHYLHLGNEAPTPPSRQAARIWVHPDYSPGATTKGVDVALIKTTSSFGPSEGGNYYKTLYSGTAASLITAGTLLSLEAYGCTNADPLVCQAGYSKTAHYAAFKPISLSGVGHYELQLQGSWTSQRGDSGGPYMMPSSTTEIAAVHYRRNPINTTHSDAVPAEKFRRWFELALDSSTIESANADANLDGYPEAYFLRRGQLGGQNWIYFTILFANGAEYDVPMIPDFGFPYVRSAFAPGDFDDDGLPEIVGQFTYDDPQNGETTESFYFGSTVANPLAFASKSFSLASSVSQQFNVADFDGDGVDDLEILDTSSGYADVYYGSTTGGLQDGSLYSGFPSSLGIDGKFLTVSGVGLATITFPKVYFQIAVPASQASFDVQIFDGDLSATNDFVGGGQSCYYLFADGDEDGLPPGWPSSPQWVAQVQDSFFPDHAWKSLYRHPAGQPKHAAALTGAGDYVYTLWVELVDGACGSAPTTVASMNAFSLRADAEIVYPTDRFQFIAHDAVGDAALVPSGTPGAAVRDTEYDGNFSIAYVPTSAWASQLLVDADADDLDDAQEAAGLFDCPTLCNPPTYDVQVTGVALGANSASRYDVYGFPWNLSSSNLLGGYENVSGQYGPSAPQDAEAHTFPTGLWPIQLWFWSSVMTHNNVHVWSPKNATQAGYFYPVGSDLRPGVARHADGLHWAACLDPLEWDASGSYGSYLPLTIGTGRNELLVRDPLVARQILNGIYRPCGVPPVPALATLMAELLAAKLNIASGSGVGPDNLGVAKIYGTWLRVSEGLDSGDGRLVLCNPDSRQQDAMQAAAAPLSAVNQGFVDNRWE